MTKTISAIVKPATSSISSFQVLPMPQHLSPPSIKMTLATTSNQPPRLLQPKLHSYRYRHCIAHAAQPPASSILINACPHQTELRPQAQPQRQCYSNRYSNANAHKNHQLYQRQSQFASTKTAYNAITSSLVVTTNDTASYSPTRSRAPSSIADDAHHRCCTTT